MLLSLYRQVRARTKKTARTNLARGSSALMASALIFSVASFGFWLGAARSYDQRSVGLAAALITVQLFVVYATNMGLPIAVSRYAAGPSDPEHMRFVVSCLYTALSGAVGAVLLGGLFASFFDSDELPLLSSSPAMLGFFAITVAGTSLTGLVDQRLLGMRYRAWILARAGIVSGIKIAAIAILSLTGAKGEPVVLFMAAVVPDAVSGLIGAGALGAHGARLLLAGERPSDMRSIFRYANVNYLTLLAWQGPLHGIPLIVLGQVSLRSYAVFYIMWSILMILIVAPRSIVRTLLVEAGRAPGLVREQGVFALKASLGLSLVILVASVPIAQVIPRVYGGEYGGVGALLPAMVMALVPWSITAVVLTVSQAERWSGLTLTIAATFSAACLACVFFLGGRYGLAGAVAGWLLGNAVTALVAVSLGRKAVGGRLSVQPATT